MNTIFQLRLRQIIRRLLASTLPRRRFLVAGPRRSQAVCLTFDDGPHAVHTPPLLDVLRDLGVPGTFFLVGERAARHPDLVRRLVAEGHAVGHHSFHHYDPARTSSRQMAAEIRRQQRLFRELIGAPQLLFRPPHGKLTPFKILRCWANGMKVILWNRDPKDYTRRHAHQVRAWFRAHPLRGGDIVLLHDNQPFAAEVVPELVQTARAAGLSFATIRDWV
jgi:peptidoglycan/xylan/chitin deacetylase (PgdA/CDA1 family)